MRYSGLKDWWEQGTKNLLDAPHLSIFAHLTRRGHRTSRHLNLKTRRSCESKSGSWVCCFWDLLSSSGCCWNLASFRTFRTTNHCHPPSEDCWKKKNTSPTAAVKHFGDDFSEFQNSTEGWNFFKAVLRLWGVVRYIFLFGTEAPNAVENAVYLGLFIALEK